MESMGFSSDNLVIGKGAVGDQLITRDTFGFAVKATYCEVDGKAINVSKEPKTDPSKKSAKGLLAVMPDKDFNLTLHDQCTPIQEELGALTTVLRDGKLVRRTSLEEIRSKLW